MGLFNTTEWFQKHIRGKSESDWDFGIADDEWWPTILQEGTPKRIVRDDGEYICGLYEYGGTYHLLGMEDRLPFPDRQNAWFDISLEDGYRVMDFMVFKRKKFPDKSAFLNFVGGFFRRKSWNDTVEKYSDLDEVKFIDVEELGGEV